MLPISLKDTPSMAIKLEANYSKKIGLAGFSSHQFSLTLVTEITDLSKVPEESERLHGLLQQSVDHSIQQVGYLPDQQGTKNGNGKTNGNGNGHPKPLTGFTFLVHMGC